MKYLFIFLLLACGRGGVDRARSDGDEALQSMLLHLKDLHAYEDVEAARGLLVQDFDAVVDAIINLERLGVRETRTSVFNDALRSELKRLYTIDGVSGLLEAYQRPALSRLDAFMKKAGQSVSDANRDPYDL